MVQFVLLLVLLAGAFYLMRGWLARQNPAALRRIFWPLIAAAVVLLLATRAGATLLYAVLPVLLPIALAMLRRQMLRPPGAGGSPFGLGGLGGGPGTAPGSSGGGGPQSQVVTRFLRMTLSHDSGELDGVVIDGRFRGQRLDDLSETELLDLWRECRRDPRSQAVLETWLDRRLGEDWRQQADGDDATVGPDDTTARPTGGRMDQAEAYAVLGLKPGASAEDVRAAHRRLMQRLHPDHGGSDYLAARINQAKDVLLGRH